MILYQNRHEKSGNHFFHAVWGDFLESDKALGSKSFINDSLSKTDRATINRQIKETSEKLEAEKKSGYATAAREAESIWERAATTGTTAYLQTKKIDDLHGAKIVYDKLLVPMRDVDGKLWSTQTVGPDGDKRFQAGGKTGECMFWVGGPPIDRAYIAEGYATAVSVYLATGIPTVCCFSCHNMAPVAKLLLAKYPNAAFTVAADRGEAGEKAAAEVQNITGGGIVYSEVGNDFSDWWIQDQTFKLKEPERGSGYAPLGYSDDHYYFYELVTREVIKCPSGLPKEKLMGLRPLEYWRSVYTTKKGEVDWDAARNDIIQASKTMGRFDTSRIRGTGVWLDRDRVIVNTGSATYPPNVSSNYHYVQEMYKLKPMSVPMTEEEGRRVFTACEAIRWKSKSDAMLLAGWLFCARIAGALPVRPHIWLTGQKGSGKSTTFEKILKPMLGEPHQSYMYYQGKSTTEPGIRQEMRASALPMIFDEFGDGYHAESIIDLLRNTWSSTAGRIVKGSTSGAAIAYQLNFCACLASVRVGLDKDEDRSRFSVLEIEIDHANSAASKAQLLMALHGLRGLAEPMFARAVSQVKNLLVSFESIANYIGVLVSHRFGEQTGMLLASCWTLLNDAPIRADQIEGFVAGFLDESIEEAKEEVPDHIACLEHLMTSTVTLSRTVSPDKEQRTTTSVRETVTNPHWHDELMKLCGVKVVGQYVYIASNHAWLENCYRGTRWDKKWSQSLKRTIPGAATVEKMSFGSRASKSRAAKVPLQLIMDTETRRGLHPV